MELLGLLFVGIKNQQSKGFFSNYSPSFVAVLSFAGTSRFVCKVLPKRLCQRKGKPLWAQREYSCSVSAKYLCLSTAVSTTPSFHHHTFLGMLREEDLTYSEVRSSLLAVPDSGHESAVEGIISLQGTAGRGMEQRCLIFLLR